MPFVVVYLAAFFTWAFVVVAALAIHLSVKPDTNEQKIDFVAGIVNEGVIDITNEKTETKKLSKAIDRVADIGERLLEKDQAHAT